MRLVYRVAATLLICAVMIHINAAADESISTQYARCSKYIEAFVNSRKREDVTLRDQIRYSRNHLRTAIKALEGEHLNLSITRPPVPDDQNGYVAYKKVQQLHANFAVPLYAYDLSPGNQYSGDELLKLRELVAENKAYFDAIANAVKRPYYQSPNPIDFLASGCLSEAARMLAVRSFLSAYDGHPEQAVDYSEQIFMIGRQLAQNNSLASYEIASIIYSMGYRSMRNVMMICPDRSDIAVRADRILSGQPDLASIKMPYLNWEAAVYFDTMTQIQTGRPGAVSATMARSLHETLKATGPRSLENPLANSAFWLVISPINRSLENTSKRNHFDVTKHVFSRREREIWNRLFYQAEADYLTELKQFTTHCDLSEQGHGVALWMLKVPQSRAASKIDEFLTKGAVSKESTLDLLTFSPTVTQLNEQVINRHARRNLTIGVARVFELERQNGRFCESIPNLPADPWSEKPLAYRLTDHGFLLYSVGSTGTYDGSKTQDLTTRKYRIVFPPEPTLRPE